VHPFCEIDQAGNQSPQLTSKQNYSGCPWQRNGCGGTSYRESTHIHPSSAPSHLVRERRGSDQFDVNGFISTKAQGHNCQNMQVVCKSLSSLPVAKTCASFETRVRNVYLHRKTLEKNEDHPCHEAARVFVGFGWATISTLPAHASGG